MSLKIINNKYVKIIGHRGLSEDYPENTVHAVKESSEYCDIVEIDVRQTADGEHIVFHDSVLKSSFKNTRHKIGESTFQEINSSIETQTIENEKYRIPKLEEALDVASVPLLVELKGDLNIKKVLDKIKTSDTRVLIQSFNPSHINKVSDNFCGKFGTLCPSENQKGIEGISKGSISEPEVCAEFIDTIGGDFVSLHYKNCTNEFVSLAHKKNLKVYVWTIRSKDSYEKSKSMGVDGVITDSISYITGFCH